MSSSQTSARFPWVALALSFLSSGVGHIYCGRIVKGLFLYSARFLLPLLCVAAAFVQPSTPVFLGMVLLPAFAIVGVFFYSPIEAYGIARRNGADYRAKDYNRSSVYWVLIAIQLAYPVALTWAICEYVYEPFFLPERSMSPNFLAGDRILVNKRPFRDDFPERGDVIVFRTPPSEKGRAWIKRVIGVAGDQITITGNKIQVNGKLLERERVPEESIAAIRDQVDGDVFYESHAGRRYRVIVGNESPEESGSDKLAIEEFNVTVPDRSVFVMGDNRERSRDSRSIGSVHVSDVIGYVDYNYFPAETWSRFGAYQD